MSRRNRSEILFTLIGHYSDIFPRDGETPEDYEERRKHIQGINHALAISIGLINPVPPKLTLCLCGACADAFRGTGAFALREAVSGHTEQDVCAYCKGQIGEYYDVLSLMRWREK